MEAEEEEEEVTEVEGGLCEAEEAEDAVRLRLWVGRRVGMRCDAERLLALVSGGI